MIICSKRALTNILLGIYHTYIMRMKKYNLYLSEQQINTLILLSEQKGLSVSEIIRRALDEYIEKESNKIQVSIVNQKKEK